MNSPKQSDRTPTAKRDETAPSIEQRNSAPMDPRQRNSGVRHLARQLAVHDVVVVRRIERVGFVLSFGDRRCVDE
jgi:hypothetical protein